MQALKSLFRRLQGQSAAVESTARPVELTQESLKLVGGGLPRVGSPEGAVVEASCAVVDGEQLPRVG